MATLKRGFRWRTKEGQTCQLADMATRHIFFSFRLLVNRSRERGQRLYTRDRNGLTPRGQTAWTLLIFVDEIFTRGDLENQYLGDLRRLMLAAFDDQYCRDLERLRNPLHVMEPVPESHREGTRRVAVREPMRVGFDPALPGADQTVSVRTIREDQGVRQDLERLGTLAFTRPMMRDMITYNPNSEEPSRLNIDRWFAFVPPPFRDGAMWTVRQISRQVVGMRAEEAVGRFVNLFLDAKERAIAQGELDRQGWRVNRSLDYSMSRVTSPTVQDAIEELSRMTGPRRRPTVQTVALNPGDSMIYITGFVPTVGEAIVHIDGRRLQENVDYTLSGQHVCLMMPVTSEGSLVVQEYEWSESQSDMLDVLRYIGATSEPGHMRREVMGRFASREPQQQSFPREKLENKKSNAIEDLTAIGRRKIQIDEEEK